MDFTKITYKIIFFIINLMSMINKTKEKKLKRKIEYLSSKLH